MLLLGNVGLTSIQFKKQDTRCESRQAAHWAICPSGIPMDTVLSSRWGKARMDRDHELTTTLRNHVLGRDQALKATGKLFFYRRNPLLEIEKETQLFFSGVLIKVAPLDTHGTPAWRSPWSLRSDRKLHSPGCLQSFGSHDVFCGSIFLCKYWEESCIATFLLSYQIC